MENLQVKGIDNRRRREKLGSLLQLESVHKCTGLDLVRLCGGEKGELHGLPILWERESS